MDEATSSVDIDTDRRIQDLVRVEFKTRTILTIAHRLNTIIDYDRVLVMDAGACAEFDTPATLLSKPNSLFAQLVDATGKSNAKFLREIVAAAGTGKSPSLQLV